MSGGGRPSARVIAEGLAAVAAVVVAHRVLRHFGLISESAPLFALGFLFVAGWVGGTIAAWCKLPRLTGNLVAGIVAGPQGLAMVVEHDVKELALVNTLALALIALQAGAEITIPALRRVWKGVTLSALAQVAIVIPGSGLVFFAVAPKMPFLAEVSTGAVAALALLWGALAFTRSPSVVMALLAELRARGPLSDWSLGIVVFLDVLVLPLFAIAVMLTKSQLLGDSLDPGALLQLGEGLFASVAAGVTFGLLLALLLHVTGERVLVVAGLAYLVTALCNYLGYDTLLTFVIAGFIVTNLARTGERLRSSTQHIGAGVMVVFFATAGAHLDLRALVALWPFALLFFAVRVALTVLSAKLGHRLARDPAAVAKNGWLVLVSQAGVTIGLAVIAGEALPGAVGEALASLAIAVVALNELVGAVLMKIGLQRAGEVGARAPA